jgi:hypothetical protein
MLGADYFAMRGHLDLAATRSAITYWSKPRTSGRLFVDSQELVVLVAKSVESGGAACIVFERGVAADDFLDSILTCGIPLGVIRKGGHARLRDGVHLASKLRSRACVA